MDFKKNLPKIAILAAAVLVLAIISILFLPKVAELLEPEGQAKFLAWMNGFGAWGYGIMLLIQIGQIIIAFIPGEPVEIVSGILYGTFGGLLLCMIGLLIGGTTTFLLARRFGAPLIRAIFPEKQLERFHVMQNAKTGQAVSFLLFLIPGTPKDLLCYVAGLTGMTLPRFLLTSMLARIPCTVCSTFAGSAIMRGNYTLAISVFVVMALLTVPGYLFYRRYSARLAKKSTQMETQRIFRPAVPRVSAPEERPEEMPPLLPAPTASAAAAPSAASAGGNADAPPPGAPPES